MAVIPDSILYPLLIPILSKSFGVNGIWLAMGYIFLLFFAVFYLGFVIKNRRLIVPLGRLLALEEKEGRAVALDVSVPADETDVTFVSEKLQYFLRDNGVAKNVALKTALCTEEIAADYIEYRKVSGLAEKKAYMDIKVYLEAKKIRIIIRNYDKPYNPLIFERRKEDFSKIGITMVQRVSEHITHSYAYHLNIISILMDI